MTVEEAFFEVCRQAEPARRHYVSLYLRTPYYGGPEEGGWWGADVALVATQCFPTDAEARIAYDKVIHLAEELSAEAKRGFGEHCLRQMEWLEARGLDSDFLPEVDGEVSYFVSKEDQPGESESRGPRHYE